MVYTTYKMVMTGGWFMIVFPTLQEMDLGIIWLSSYILESSNPLVGKLNSNNDKANQLNFTTDIYRHAQHHDYIYELAPSTCFHLLIACQQIRGKKDRNT